jgi:hypothetical protein
LIKESTYLENSSEIDLFWPKCPQCSPLWHKRQCPSDEACLHNNPKISGPLGSKEDRTSEIRPYVDKLSIPVPGIGKCADQECFDRKIEGF